MMKPVVDRGDWELIRRLFGKSWKWSVGLVIAALAVLFGDLISYFSLTEYVMSRRIVVYGLLAVPFAVAILLGMLRASLQEIKEAEASLSSVQTSRPVYKRVRMIASRELSVDGSVRAHNEVEVQAVGDAPLRSVRHRRSIVEIGLFDSPTFKFKGGSRDGPGGMSHKVMNVGERLITWVVEFTPPLETGQRARYSYLQTSIGPFAMTKEQIYKELSAGLRSSNYSYWRMHMVAPTDRLVMRMRFPRGYEIRLPESGGFNVYLGTTEEERETQRLHEERAFVVDKDSLSGQWFMELNVPNAHMGLTYVLEWDPPRQETLRTLGKTDASQGSELLEPQDMGG